MFNNWTIYLLFYCYLTFNDIDLREKERSKFIKSINILPDGHLKIPPTDKLLELTRDMDMDLYDSAIEPWYQKYLNVIYHFML